jgi:hypothetical protein
MFWLLSSPSYGRGLVKGFVIDRAVLALTGFPATKQQIEDYEAGIPLKQILDPLKTQEITENYIAKFYFQEFGHLNFIDIGSWGYTNIEGRGTDLKGVVQGQAVSPRGGDLSSFIYSGKLCAGKSIAYASFRTSEVASDPAFDSISGPICGCDESSTNLITPWWDPANQILICNKLDDEKVCGENLIKCFGSSILGSSKIDNANADATLEPSALIAKNIVYGEDYREVLTSKKTVTTQILLNAIRHPRTRHMLDLAFPDGTFDHASDIPGYDTVLTKGITDESMRDPYNNSKYLRYERGGDHAGVLTTASYIQTYNGRYAMAAKARNMFLCRTYEPPVGTKQVVSDEQDLTKKPYCSECHKHLNPIASFFDRFPLQGLSYQYYQQPAVPTAHGSYLGEEGNGTTALANIFAKSFDFKKCAVKKAFQFLVRRKMNANEELYLMPELVTKFENSNHALWETYMEIIKTPAFTGATTEVQQ